jgi:hypothetical protein
MEFTANPLDNAAQFMPAALAEPTTLVLPEANVYPPAVLSADIEVGAKPERERVPDFKVREAALADIPEIVDVDMKSFAKVYKEYGETEDELRDRLTTNFEGRFNLVGGYWMPVLEKDGKIVGFMTSCPTSKDPEDFKSWEETTDNGTLHNTYNPDGRNVYVVTLSVLPEGTPGKDMLYANQIGKMLEGPYDKGFFESRMPGFRLWAVRKARESGTRLNALSEEERNAYAEEYFTTKITDEKGKQVPLDPLLRLYERIGCKLLKVVPDAYEDAPSMNYGVVCVYDGEKLFDGSDLPVALPDNKLTRKLFGKLLQHASRSQRMTAQLFGGEPLPRPRLRDSAREHVSRNRWKYLLGAMAVSAGISLYEKPAETLEQGAIVGGALTALEATWIATGTTALGSAGFRINPATALRHPIATKNEIVENLPKRAEQARGSKIFKASFVANRAIAYAEAAIPAVLVTTHLPVESWGMLAPFALDAFVTYRVGSEVMHAISREDDSEDSTSTPIDITSAPQEA